MLRSPAGAAAFVLVSALLLASCNQFFSVNLFQQAGLGQQSTPSASALATMSVSDLQSLAESPSFYTDLSNDATKKGAVFTNLQGAYSSPSNSVSTIQSAAALYADVQLNTTDGAAIVAGLVSAAATTNISGLGQSTIVSFIKATLPADVLADSTGTKFAQAVDAILAAKPAYDAIGATIQTSGWTGGTSTIGDVAQGALLAYALAGTATSNGPAGGPPNVTDLWTMINGTGSATVTSFTTPNSSNLSAILTAAHSPYTF
ncbi:MAG TPA: hypothetical protein VMV90_15750 [Rectinemataceae bacterium]|nr:hypothetical protein [Rectinemataceae bacterium]